MSASLPGGRGHIVLSHANGFPWGTYQVLIDRWRAAGWEVSGVARFGHDPVFPVNSHWRGLRDQLIAHIDAQQAGPVFLVGHSLGGLLSLLAACRRPDLARGVVMLDSPVITGWRAHSLQVLKRTGLIRRVSPGKVSQRRRHVWPDREAVYQHFKPKAAFAPWDDRVLRAYVQAGFDEGPDGQIHLGFDRQVETRIYNTLPHDLGALIRRHPPRCPVGFIAGTQSVEMRQGGVQGAKALAGSRYLTVEGGHLYPMVHPERTADQVLDLIEDMLKPAVGRT